MGPHTYAGQPRASCARAAASWQVMMAAFSRKMVRFKKSLSARPTPNHAAGDFRSSVAKAFRQDDKKHYCHHVFGRRLRSCCATQLIGWPVGVKAITASLIGRRQLARTRPLRSRPGQSRQSPGRAPSFSLQRDDDYHTYRLISATPTARRLYGHSRPPPCALLYRPR